MKGRLLSVVIMIQSHKRANRTTIRKIVLILCGSLDYRCFCALQMAKSAPSWHLICLTHVPTLAWSLASRSEHLMIIRHGSQLEELSLFTEQRRLRRMHCDKPLHPVNLIPSANKTILPLDGHVATTTNNLAPGEDVNPQQAKRLSRPGEMSAGGVKQPTSMKSRYVFLPNKLEVGIKLVTMAPQLRHIIVFAARSKRSFDGIFRSGFDTHLLRGAFVGSTYATGLTTTVALLRMVLFRHALRAPSGDPCQSPAAGTRRLGPRLQSALSDDVLTCPHRRIVGECSGLASATAPTAVPYRYCTCRLASGSACRMHNLVVSRSSAFWILTS